MNNLIWIMNIKSCFERLLVLGISIGVSFNVIFSEWMITILLITIFTVMATKAFLKGVETWRKETRTKKEAAQCLQTNGLGGEVVEGPSNGSGTETKDTKRAEVSILKNIYRKAVGVLVAVWVIILAFQIGKG
ncbi:sulfite exporter TauE/SafE family protein 3-like isoform X2 [Corylus avellana]|uniref:sulfite exporter TauE/SafE family protein 3-like isoform X2 n=1 Tax=Corylus avellana TaxID=13451 RepID=UPI00286AEE1A|nr:sulfite exporter TauE/SafE family protein 3-like isoform X2 [Corylus avellana]